MMKKNPKLEGSPRWNAKMRHTEFPRVQGHLESAILTGFRIGASRSEILLSDNPPSALYPGSPNRGFFCREAARLDSLHAR